MLKLFKETMQALILAMLFGGPVFLYMIFVMKP
jgi:hypothetical protein